MRACPTGEIEDVWFGCANQAGEDNRNVARMAALLAGLPESVAGVTVNRLCASGLAAVVGACHAVVAGDGDLFVAGGVESMSRAPLVMGKPDKAFPRGNQTVWDTTLGWRFPNPRMEELFPLESMGETGENVAERWGVSREDQDAFALASQQRWAAADAAGRFADELVPVGELDARRAPAPRHDAEKLAALKPAFRKDGTVTAGNSSGLNDGAAALVVASEERARALGVEPLGAFVGSRGRRRRPARDGHRPDPGGAEAARAAPGSTSAELDLVELNEAFASQSLVVDPRARARPGEGERQRRRDRARPSARDERRAARRLAPARARPPRRPVRARDDVRRRRPGPGGTVRAWLAAPRTTSCSGCGWAGTSTAWSTRTAGPAELKRAGRRGAAGRAGSALVEQARGARWPSSTDGWLRDQALGLRTYAGVLAGEGHLLLGRGRGLLRRPARARDTDVYAAAHEQLDELLPGSGPLAERYDAWRRAAPSSDRPGRPGCCARSPTCCATATAALVDLPAGEALTIEEVRDEPWWAFNYYLGGLRSRVVVNLDVPDDRRRRRRARRARGLPGPPHRARAQGAAVRRVDRARSRSRSSSCPTPAALVSEGIAETGPTLVLDGEVDERLDCDSCASTGSRATRAGRAIREARRPLRRIGLDAALMIHEDGASAEEAEASRRALGARHARGGRAQRPLRHRSDLARLRDHLLRRAASSATRGSAAIRRGSRAC